MTTLGPSTSALTSSVVRSRDGHRAEGALIEIQLRTELQQRWSKLVEDLDAAYRANFKNEVGPDEVLDYLRAYGSSLAMIDRTGHVDPALVRLVGRLRGHAQRRLAAGGHE